MLQYKILSQHGNTIITRDILSDTGKFPHKYTAPIWSLQAGKFLTRRFEAI